MQITLPIDAVPQGRPRFVNGVAIDPPKSRQFKIDVGWLVKSFIRDKTLLTGELKVTMWVYRKLKRRTSQRFGDIDNLVKSLMDAMTGVVWQDDRQVVELHAYKCIDATPRVVIDIERIE